MTREESLKELLWRQAREGALGTPLGRGWVRCVACGHRCRIAPGKDGVCRVRFNRDGSLFVPFGYVSGLQVDPIEKKPFYHAFPGAEALSFGMLGCDYHCAYCQNWITSQALRDPEALAAPTMATADQIVALALRYRTPVITSTYNEPLITSEWAVEIFRLARAHGITCSYVSNGNATPEVLEYLRPWIGLYKIDLKSFSPRSYRTLGGRLETVLETIRTLAAWGIWIEVVTLVVPGLNDTPDELAAIAQFLASVSIDIPWHVTAFHPDFRMTGQNTTSAAALIRAAEIGRGAGLRFVYAGNIPGIAPDLENTCCPSCSVLLIERRGFRVLTNRIADGRCPDCSAPIPGVWG